MVFFWESFFQTHNEILWTKKMTRKDDLKSRISSTWLEKHTELGYENQKRATRRCNGWCLDREYNERNAMAVNSWTVSEKDDLSSGVRSFLSFRTRRDACESIFTTTTFTTTTIHFGCTNTPVVCVYYVHLNTNTNAEYLWSRCVWWVGFRSLPLIWNF